MDCPRCNSLVVPDIPSPLPRNFCQACGWDTYPEPILQHTNGGMSLEDRNGAIDLSDLGPLPDAFQVSDLVDQLRSMGQSVTYAELGASLEKMGYRVSRRLVIKVVENDGPLWASFDPLPPLIVGPAHHKPPTDGPTERKGSLGVNSKVEPKNRGYEMPIQACNVPE